MSTLVSDMLGRRLLILLAILVGLGALAAAVTPRDGAFRPPPPPAGSESDRQDGAGGDGSDAGAGPQASTEGGAERESTAPPAPEATAGDRQPDGEGAMGAEVEATLSSEASEPSTVEAEVGDHVRLTVRSDQPTSVRIEGRAGIEQSEPSSPARFSFIATQPGRFPIVLQDSAEPVGTLVVRSS